MVGGLDGAAPIESTWYVALAQLPGVPVKLRLAVLDVAIGAVQQLTVCSRRNHLWAGMPRGSESGSEDNDDPVPVVEEVPDPGEPQGRGRDAAVEAGTGVDGLSVS
jgi:hypothetical protein